MIIETRDGPGATVRMDNPAHRNAFSIPMRLALLDAFRKLEADADVRAVVFTGGAKIFSVGGDVRTMGNPSMLAALDRMRIVHDLVRLLANSAKPIVAAVEGWAVGGGFALSLLCDTVVAAEDARFKAGFGEIGAIGDTGILHTLPARVGTGRAKQILFYNEAISARQALEWGVIDVVAPPGQAFEEATRLARVLAAKAPLPIALTKSIFAAGLDDLLVREREVQAMLLGSADHAEGKAAFFEKRPPVFRGC